MQLLPCLSDTWVFVTSLILEYKYTQLDKSKKYKNMQ